MQQFKKNHRKHGYTESLKSLKKEKKNKKKNEWQEIARNWKIFDETGRKRHHIGPKMGGMVPKCAAWC